MSTKSEEVICGGRIMGAKMRAETAHKGTGEAVRNADRAEAEAWSTRMEGYGGPAQPSPTIGQCINGGLSWLKVECNRCETKASLPLDAYPPAARDAAVEAGSLVKMPLLPQGPLGATGAHDQADRGARSRPTSGCIRTRSGEPAPPRLAERENEPT